MNAENGMTVAKFAAELAARFPDENPITVKTKVYQWVKKGLVPHKRVPANRLPDEAGIIVVTADPSTFELPFPFGPGPTPEGEGVRVSVAARRLGLSTTAVYNRLRKLKIAGRRVPEELLEEWIQERKR